ncbi:MAG: single-stranded-DNA-specific exonuclease RecJ [Chloroflexi bacterium GWC2_73_18]|nr:MAG: single-stranded-DNA-specific exonuclease RecJ [Chloroflexi bacterium GWC2_73_18]
MLQPQRRWQFPPPVVVDPALAASQAARGLSRRLLELLVARGHGSAAALAAFLGPPEAGLHDPGLLPDAARLVSRVDRAVGRGERVLVFGDFDADGLTGLAILVEALRARGLETHPYVPSRVREGHGLSLQAVEQATAEGRTLILTADTGTTSHAEVAAAAALGIDVVITDHHHTPADLPEAVAVVNPHRHDATYPDRELSGAGVAFKVAQLLLAPLAGGARRALDLADLATIGSIADVAPVAGENRAIARLGLERIRTAARPGLAALLGRAGLAPERVDLEALAFVVAPRINAAGRVGDAEVAARLLLATDPAEAEALAGELEAANDERRALLAAALETARAAAALEPDPPAVAVAGPWPVGIIGLLAGRLAEDAGRPALVVSTLVEPWRGSARSAGGVDLASAMEGCGHLLERFGGHAAAAGCSVAEEAWPAFRERFRALVAAAGPIDPRPPLRVDLALSAAEIDYRLLRELSLLAPTGPGNPDPLLAVLGVEVVRVRAANGGHTQLTLRKGLEVLDGIAFGRPDLAGAVAPGDRLDVVGRLASRSFGGFESLQLEIRDAATSGLQRPMPAAAATPAVASEMRP